MDNPIARYLNIRSSFHPNFSSDGQRLAFLSDISGLFQAWQVELSPSLDPTPWPDQLTFEEDHIRGVWCSPAPGDNRIIYARDTGGDENAQLYLLSPDGAADLPLTAGFSQALHGFGDWSADGQAILYAANRRDPGLFDLYYHRLDGQAKLVWQNDQPGFLAEMIFTPDGRQALVNLMAGSFDHQLVLVDLVTGSGQILSLTKEPTRFHDLRFAPDGRTVYLNTDLDSDFLYLAQLDLASLTLKPLVKSTWDTEFLAISPDGRQLAYTINRQGASELYLYDLRSGGGRSAPPLNVGPGAVANADWFLTFSPDGQRLAFSFSAAARTLDIFIWELASDVIKPVTRSSHGGLDPAKFVKPELIHYPTFDADRTHGVGRIPAWFFRPTSVASGGAPVVVLVHGGPEAQFQPYFSFMIQYLTRHGYAVLAPNVRGSTGYGKRYSHLDDVEKRLDSVADLAYAARWLKGQPGIDGERIVVYGGSYGGFMVLAALTNYPDLWAAGVDIVGISNFVTFLENTSEYRRAHREAEYGRLDRDREFLESISPANHLEQICAPLMIIHGANDPRVPLSEAEQIVTALQERGVPVEFLVFDDEGHGISKLKNKLVAYPAIIAFLNKVLPASQMTG